MPIWCFHSATRVGLTLFAESVLAHLKPRAKSRQLDEILMALATAPGNTPAASAAVLHEVAELMPRRGLVVLISDLFFPTEDIFSGLDHLLFRGHDLIIFHLLDPLENALSISGQVRFRDLETGEELTTQTDEIRALYEKALVGVAARAGRRAAGPVGRPGAGDDRPTDRAGAIRLPDETISAFLIASATWPVWASYTWVFLQGRRRSPFRS